MENVAAMLDTAFTPVEATSIGVYFILVLVWTSPFSFDRNFTGNQYIFSPFSLDNIFIDKTRTVPYGIVDNCVE